MLTKSEIEALEGWLIKKTQKDGNSLFAAFKSGDNRRWFKVREVRSYENVELALCYFKTNKDKDARGWIYLKDVTDIIDDGFMFTIVSSARTMHLEAHSKAEHRLWLQGIVNLCPNANTSRIQSNIKLPIKASAVDLTESLNNTKNSGNENISHYDKEKKRDQFEETDQDSIKSKISGPKLSQVERFEREDHRLAGNRFGASSIANRLHGHIKKDSNDVPYPEERESKLETPSSVQPVTPLKYPSKNTTSPDMEDIEILNLDKVISKKQLRLRNRNKRNKDSNYDDDTGSSEEEEDNDEDTRAEEKSNNSIAEPIMAPLRRARDELNDGSMSKRTSIDDLLHIQGSSSFKDEPASPVLDLKAEKAIRESYHNNNIVAEAKPLINTSNVSKPPRPPNPKPPYAQKAKNQTVDNSGIASSIVDKSFVNEDWDESSPEKNKLKQTKNVQGGGPGVQADANWLDEDFDD